MVIFPVKEEPNLEQKVRELLGNREPSLVWADNLQENYRFWGIYPLFAPEGILLRDVTVPLGDYGLILPSGCRMEKRTKSGAAAEAIRQKDEDTEETEWRITGDITFRYEGISARLQEVLISEEGIFEFTFACSDMKSWGAGIRYSLPVYDEWTKRTVFRQLFSEVFTLEEQPELKVRFFPAFTSKNCWKIVKPVTALTALRTIHSENIRLFLPEGFGFRIALGADHIGRGVPYFTPSGTAKIAQGTMFMPGLSGTEYLETGEEICFCPGGKACFGENDLQIKPDTAYLSFPGGTYFTQPNQMSFYKEKEAGIYECARLPGVPAGKAELAVLPFGSLTGNGEEALELESRFLCSSRKEAVEKQISAEAFLGETLSYAITRSGMKAAYDSGKLVWMQTAPLKEGEPGLGYTYMSSRFWFSLLSPELFIALTDLTDRASVPYSVTKRRLQLAKTHGYNDTGKLETLLGRTFFGSRELQEAVGQTGALWNTVIRDACSHFNQNLAGWEFCFSPELWQAYRTLAVIKLTDGKSLDECIRDPMSFSLQLKEEELSLVEQYYQEILCLSGKPEFEYLAELIQDKKWKGSLFFNAGADIAGLPQELTFLAGGIEPSAFRAAYVAFPATGAGEEKASGSALLHYEDKESLQPEEYLEFAFKVRQLKLDIRENHIYQFYARVELLINSLFGYKTVGNKEGGCSLVFTGSYQENEEGGYYGFSLEQPVEYVLTGCGIEAVCIERARLLTEGKNSRFVLGGFLKLMNQEDMDLLSFEKLPFDGLTVEMTASEKGYSFRADYETLRLCGQEGEMREDSFGVGFPTVIDRLIMEKGRKPPELGFETIKIKGYGSGEELEACWMGFLWKIETGNLGGLAAKSNLTLELLAAFAEDEKNSRGLPRFYCGVRIGSLIKTDTFSLPLQGIMSLGFDSIELKKDEGFYFRFRNFSLTIFGRRFPETNNDLYLMGDEDGNLGWYGAAEG